MMRIEAIIATAEMLGASQKDVEKTLHLEMIWRKQNETN